jgi:hypothetical protein
MKILAIEPLGVNGHITFNNSFLLALSKIGDITFVTFPDYHRNFKTDTQIDIPRKFQGQNSKFSTRWNQILALIYIKKKIKMDDYDAIVFLAYETISLYICWPKHQKVYLFEHNNISNALRSKIKMYFYKHLPAVAVHVVFMEYIAEFIGKQFKREAITIPLPIDKNITKEDIILRFQTSMEKLGSDKKVVFSPSGLTPLCVIQDLKFFVTNQNGYYLFAKGQKEDNGDKYCIRSFFKNYKDLMINSSIVIIGGTYNYRISGVVYDALSYCKPIIIFRSQFGHELNKRYPGFVFQIDKIEDIQNIKTDPILMKKTYQSYLIEHSFDTILKKLQNILERNSTRCSVVT